MVDEKSVTFAVPIPEGRGFGARLGWIPVGALRFFCFWLYKKPKKVILVSGAGPDFRETIFWKRR